MSVFHFNYTVEVLDPKGLWQAAMQDGRGHRFGEEMLARQLGTEDEPDIAGCLRFLVRFVSTEARLCVIDHGLDLVAVTSRDDDS